MQSQTGPQWPEIGVHRRGGAGMIIKFSWDSGYVMVDAELLILEMPMDQYKKWVKLFARYGRSEDHVAFLQLLEDQIRENEQAIKDLEVTIATAKHKSGLKAQLSYLRRMLKRRLSMRDQLRGLLS